MALNSRAKGASGERELAAVLRDHGFEARRGQQFSGGTESPDVVGLPGWHIECKRVEAGSPYSWLNQAIRDSAPKPKEALLSKPNTPVVMHRRNGREWVAILRLEDFLSLVKGQNNAVS